MNWVNQIIIGTILGGSSLVKPKNGKNCYLIMRSKDVNWINYKIKELESIGTNNVNYEGNSIRWRSDTCELLTTIYNLIYNNNKKEIQMSLLDTLRDIGLAIWFGDKAYVLNKKIIMNINNYNLLSRKTIKKYFDEIGLSCSCYNIRNSNRLLFDNKNSKKFLAIIGEKLPEFILNKIEI